MTFPRKICERVSDPTPDEVEQARVYAGLDQSQAGEVISGAKLEPRKTWAGYESVHPKNRRKMPLASWELFLLMTGQHPSLELVEREQEVGEEVGSRLSKDVKGAP